MVDTIVEWEDKKFMWTCRSCLLLWYFEIWICPSCKRPVEKLEVMWHDSEVDYLAWRKNREQSKVDKGD